MNTCSTCPHPAKCRAAGKCLKKKKTTKKMGSFSEFMERWNDVSAAQLNTISGGLLYPQEGPAARKRARAKGDMR